MTNNSADSTSRNYLEKVLGNRICRGSFLFALCLLNTALILRNVDINTPLIDFTYQLENSYRIYVGQVPYRDFFLVLTPGIYYLTALFLQLFHNSNLGMIVLTVLIQCVGIVLSYIILLKLCRNNIFFYLYLITISFSEAIFYPFPVYNTVCFDMMLLFLAFYVWNENKMTRFKWFLAGILTTWPYIFKQNYGLFFAFAVYFFVFNLLMRRRQFKDCAYMISGSAISALVFILFLAMNKIKIYDYIYQTLIFPGQTRHPFGLILLSVFSIFNWKTFVFLVCMFFSIFFLKFDPINERLKILLLSLLFGALYFIFYHVEIPYLNTINAPDPDFDITFWSLIYFALIFIWLIDAFFTRKFFSTESITIISFFIMIFGIFTRDTCGPTWLLVYAADCLYEKLKKTGLSVLIVILLIIFTVDSVYASFNISYGDYVDENGDWEAETDIDSKFYKIGTKGGWLSELKNISAYIEENIGVENFVEIPCEDPIYWATETTPSLNFFQLYYATCPYSIDEIPDILSDNNIEFVIVKEKTQFKHYIINDDNVSEFEGQLETRGYARLDETGVYAIYSKADTE